MLRQPSPDSLMVESRPSFCRQLKNPPEPSEDKLTFVLDQKIIWPFEFKFGIIFYIFISKLDTVGKQITPLQPKKSFFVRKESIASMVLSFAITKITIGSLGLSKFLPFNFVAYLPKPRILFMQNSRIVEFEAQEGLFRARGSESGEVGSISEKSRKIPIFPKEIS